MLNHNNQSVPSSEVPIRGRREIAGVAHLRTNVVTRSVSEVLPALVRSTPDIVEIQPTEQSAQSPVANWVHDPQPSATIPVNTSPDIYRTPSQSASQPQAVPTESQSQQEETPPATVTDINAHHATKEDGELTEASARQMVEQAFAPQEDNHVQAA